MFFFQLITQIMLEGRCSSLKIGNQPRGPVVYWMLRDHRVNDNWAFLYSVSKANETNSPLAVVCCIAPLYPNSGVRSIPFLTEGLAGVAERLMELGAQFIALRGAPQELIPAFLKEVNASLLVSDFDPLRIKREWKDSINSSIGISHVEVDAHNIVPCRVASAKQEYGAYTIRPKINRLLHRYLAEFPSIPELRVKSKGIPFILPQALDGSERNGLVKPPEWIRSGEPMALIDLKKFIRHKLNGYSRNRNNPMLGAQSGLSPHLHYGQLSAQRVAIETIRSTAPKADREAFLDELIVRRELSDNFCLYTPNYDTFEGFHPWAKATLNQHRCDEREYTYTLEQFEHAKTHDSLWNASQRQMVNTGKMHGYLRMYWAKKVLEWTPSPEEAMRTAIYLNDKYSLDGCDPNGYAGIAWSIGGTHDRAWSERPIFGKVRYMNYNGCKRKFDVEGFVSSQP